jgi:PAS domain-containing protein
MPQSQTAARSPTRLDAAVDGTIVIAPVGIAQTYNPAREQLFGYAAGPDLRPSAAAGRYGHALMAARRPFPYVSRRRSLPRRNPDRNRRASAAE